MKNNNYGLQLQPLDFTSLPSAQLDADMKKGANLIFITPQNDIVPAGHHSHELYAPYSVTVYSAFDTPVTIIESIVQDASVWDPTAIPDEAITMHTKKYMEVENFTIPYIEDTQSGYQYWRIQFYCYLSVVWPVINICLKLDSPKTGNRGGVSIGAASVGKIIQS